MHLTYDLLLKLCGGEAAVVERLTPEQRGALWVETPVASFLRKEAAAERPRHLFLSGSAGDGKTTLMQVTREHFPDSRWHVELDASSMDVPDLVDALTRALQSGKRLFVAVNRGQLERLAAAVRQGGSEPDLKEVIDAVQEGLRLRVRWTEPDLAKLKDVVTLDLSLQDSLAQELVESLLDKACGASPPSHPETAAAFVASREKLRRTEVRERVFSALRAVQLSGHHVTMRSLWSFVSHLLTGGLADPPQRHVTVEDHVGCRLFSEPTGIGEVPVVRLVARYADPAREPWPSVTRKLILERGAGSSSVRAGPAGEADELSAADAVRSMWLDGVEPVGAWRPDLQANTYARVREAALAQRGHWLKRQRLSRTLLRDLAELAGDNAADGGQRLPAWRRLAYEDQNRELAPAVASEEIDHDRLHVGVPSPSPAAREALGNRSRVPFIWFADSSSPAGARLRLTPRLLAAVDAMKAVSGSQQVDPRSPEIVALRHWLSRLPTTPMEERVLVLDQRLTLVQLEREVFTDRVDVQVQRRSEGDQQ